MPNRLLFVSFCCLLVVSSAVAADLPGWTDDSALSVSPYPRAFSPLRESANLVTRIYHGIDRAAVVHWQVSVLNAKGSVIRTFTASQMYQPGEAILFAPTWNGRDELGRLQPDGLYTVIADVEMRGADTKVVPRTGEENGPRVQLIRQQMSHPITIDSSRRRRLTLAPLAAPHDAGVPYNFYYGTLHNQTSYSDGGHPNDSTCASSTIHAAGDFDPAAAYNYARNTAHLDFMAIVDHNHLFNDACSGCTAPQVVQRYHTGLSAAATATVDGAFVGMYGMEWGYISNPDAGFPNEGHVGVFESPKLFGWEPSSTCTVGVDCYYDVYTASGAAGYTAMYTTALQNPSVWGAFGQFMHPSDGTKSAAGQGVDFNNIQYTTDGDDFIHTVAVISGPATGFSTTTTDTGALYAGEPVNGPSYAAYTSTDMYNRILGAGYHVAPTADPDVHCSNYGTSTRDRTVILASSLTKAALFDAIHNRRVYATSDTNVQLVYTMNAGGTTSWMGAGGIRTGGPVPTTGAITLHVSVWDPDTNEFASSIKIKEPVPGNTTGAETVIATSTASPFDYTFTPPAGKHCYYVYVTMNTGDRVFSAPIWINEGATADTTAPTTSITAPSNAATVSGTTTVTASASDNVGVTKVEFYLDNALQSTSTASPYQWSWNTTTAANGTHVLNSKAYDAAGNVGTSANVTVTVSNAPPDTTPPTAPSSLTASSTTRRKVDLSWTAATDNVGVTGYQVWRATSSAGPFGQIATTTTTSYTDSTKTGTSYWYYVKATDAAGNVSAASNTATVTSR